MATKKVATDGVTVGSVTPSTPSARVATGRANGLVHVSVQRWRCRLARADPASGAAPAGTGTGTGTGSASDGGSRAGGASSNFDNGSEASGGGGRTGDDRSSVASDSCSGGGGETSGSGGENLLAVRRGSSRPHT